MKLLSLFLCLLFLSVLFAGKAYSQDNYEIQVYGSDLVEKAHTMFELHSNTSLKYRQSDNLFASDYFRETLEITHGFSRWFELGSYLFTNIGINGTTDIVGSHIRPRISVPEDLGLPVGLSLSSEIGYVKKKYSPSQWTAELRPIIDKKWEKILLAFNMVLGFDLDRGADRVPDLGSAFKASYDVTRKIAAGLEYYGGYGPLSDILPYAHQQHQVFAVLDIDFGPAWEFNSGLGWSLTNSSDRLILKFILGRRFGF